jgi:hypothetical protein
LPGRDWLVPLFAVSSNAFAHDESVPDCQRRRGHSRCTPGEYHARGASLWNRVPAALIFSNICEIRPSPARGSGNWGRALRRSIVWVRPVIRHRSDMVDFEMGFPATPHEGRGVQASLTPGPERPMRKQFGKGCAAQYKSSGPGPSPRQAASSLQHLPVVVNGGRDQRDHDGQTYVLAVFHAALTSGFSISAESPAQRRARTRFTMPTRSCGEIVVGRQHGANQAPPASPQRCREARRQPAQKFRSNDVDLGGSEPN